ncbi:MAG: hypothetical protein ABI855_16735 [Bacteroidota bacterium]
MEGSFNSEHKVFIRENWNKPLLKFLTKKVNDRLLYLGLPSPKAEDILQWIGYLKSVIAFQCREYGEVSDEGQGRKDIEELNSLLKKLEREKQIENYVVFDGYLEEVILRGFDNSPTRINFELNDFITLYNLDFCNKITSPIKYVDQNGEPQTAYKFHAINKLLQIQQSLSAASNKFVLFLTVHCSYDGEELQIFINNPPSAEIGNYIQKCNGLRGHEKNARIVRLFFAYHIKQQFEAFGFTPKILPSLFYQGLENANLLHFSVLGISPANLGAAGVPSFQSLTEVINQKFISINELTFINKTIDFEGEADVELNPVTLFSQSATFQNLWVAEA